MTEPVLVIEGASDAPLEIEGVGVAGVEGMGSATPARKNPTPKALPGVEATLHAPPRLLVMATAEKLRKLFCVVLADGAKRYTGVLAEPFSTIAYALAAPGAPAWGMIAVAEKLHV